MRYVFTCGGHGRLLNLKGMPLGDLQILTQSGRSELGEASARNIRIDRSPSSIAFLRSKILYARPTLNSRGAVTFGLRHIRKMIDPNFMATLTVQDVLNRYPYRSKSVSLEEGSAVHPNTLQVIKYIFPRQFGLHNVFDSVVDFRETVHPFKDYTLREDEIRRLPPNHKGASTKIPRRLRGSLVGLVRKLQILHERCSYGQMVAYYCPSKVRTLSAGGLILISFRHLQPFRNPRSMMLHATFKSRNQRQEATRELAPRRPVSPRSKKRIPSWTLLPPVRKCLHSAVLYWEE